MMERVVLFPIVLALTAVLCHCQDASLQDGKNITRNVSISPIGSNAQYDGLVAVFGCRSFNYEYIGWGMLPVDGNESQIKILDESTSGVTISRSTDTLGNWRFSNLSISARLNEHNNSLVACFAFLVTSPSGEDNQVQRDYSRFYVQGLPGKVRNFQGNNMTATRLRFKWNPPYHVPGISCCDRYAVNITNIDSGNTLMVDDEYMDTSVMIDVPEEHLCSLYLITISAFNGLGEGEELQAIWSLGGYFEADQATEMLAYDESADLNLDVTVKIDGYCLNELDNITLTVVCDSASRVLRQTKDVEADKNVKSIPEEVGLTIPSTHTDSLCSFEVALESKVDLQGKEFSTFDVQEVNMTVNPGEVCVVCKYITNSPGRGCVLFASRAGIDRNTSFVNIPIDEAEGCLALKIGIYRIDVFDWQADGERSDEPVYSDIIEVFNPLSSDEPAPTVETLSVGVISGISVAFIALVGVIVALIVLTVFITKRSSGSARHRGPIGMDDLGEEKIKLDDCPLVFVDHEQFKTELENENFEKWGFAQKHVKMKKGVQGEFRYFLIVSNWEDDVSRFMAANN